MAGFRQPWRFPAPLLRRRAWLGTKTPPAGFPPANTSAPVVSGALIVGQVLSSTTGGWTNSPTAYAYQWRRNGVDIAGAVASTYTLTIWDAGATITCQVTASNAFGSATALSNAVGPIAGIATRTLFPKVEIAFSVQLAAGSGFFILDSSLLDSADKLGYDAAFGGGFSEVTDDVDEDVQVVFGSDDLAAGMQAATCDFALTRPDDTGYWNPRNQSSPVNSQPPGFVEMRPVRVTVTNGIQTYGLFYGFIRNAHFDAATGVCQVHCEDLLLWLSRAYPVIAATGPTTTGAAVGLLLDAIGWDVSLRDLDDGDAIPSFSADGSKSGVELLQELLEAERGSVYVEPTSGAFVYGDRHYPGSQDPIATLTNQLVDAAADLDLDRITTRVSVTRTGGVEQAVTDTEAEQQYGRGGKIEINTPYLVSDE